MTDKQRRKSFFRARTGACATTLAAALLWGGHALAAAPATEDTVLLRGPAGQVTLADVQALASIATTPEQRQAVLASRNSLEQLALAAYTQKDYEIGRASCRERV